MKSHKTKTKTKDHQKRNRESREEEDDETATDFAFTVTKVAVSQICRRSVGFAAAESSALKTLTLVATKYLQELASTAASYSHAAGRTESNLLDITNALNDMSFAQGFPGASTLDKNCLLSSGALKEIAGFVNYSSEIPFAKPIPRNKNVNANLVCFKKDDELSARRSLHIPKWLPAFPDEETYKERRGLDCNKSEILWENSELEKEERCNFGGDKWEVLSGDMGKDREKVSFKIGVKGTMGLDLGLDLGNEVCRGVL